VIEKGEALFDLINDVTLKNNIQDLQSSYQELCSTTKVKSQEENSRFFQFAVFFPLCKKFTICFMLSRHTLYTEPVIFNYFLGVGGGNY